MSGSLSRERQKVTVFINGPMERSMMGNGKEECDMGRESGKEQDLTVSISGIGQRIELMGMVPIHGPMVTESIY